VSREREEQEEEEEEEIKRAGYLIIIFC